MFFHSSKSFQIPQPPPHTTLCSLSLSTHKHTHDHSCTCVHAHTHKMKTNKQAKKLMKRPKTEQNEIKCPQKIVNFVVGNYFEALGLPWSIIDIQSVISFENTDFPLSTGNNCK